MREQAITRLSQILGTVIESQQVTVEEAASSLAQILATITLIFDEQEFEHAMGKIGSAVRQNRAIIQRRSQREMN